MRCVGCCGVWSLSLMHERLVVALLQLHSARHPSSTTAQLLLLLLLSSFHPGGRTEACALCSAVTRQSGTRRRRRRPTLQGDLSSSRASSWPGLTTPGEPWRHYDTRPVWARERCRISPPRFLAECCKKQLNQGSFVLPYFTLFTCSDLY